MDYVEITPEVAPRPPKIVMRGFINTVCEHGSISDGQPVRLVQVNGRDFGSLLLNTKLYYLDSLQQIEIFNKWREGFLKLFAWSSGSPPPPEHPPLARNVNTDAPQFAPGDLLWNVFQTFYEPQETLILRQFPTVPPMRFFPVVNALLSTNERNLATIAPDILCLNWAPYTDV